MSEEHVTCITPQQVPKSGLGEVVIVVHMDRLQMLALVHAELVEGFVLVGDTVLVERLVHVEHAAVVLPRVRGRVRVMHQVALEDLVHYLLGAHLQQHAQKDVDC